MIHFRAVIEGATFGPLAGIALTPTDLALMMSGHPLFLDLWKAGMPDAKGFGIYFVRDSKELAAVLRKAGMDQIKMEEAGITLDGKQAVPKALPREKEEFFR